jgi:hypothetical protein
MRVSSMTNLLRPLALALALAFTVVATAAAEAAGDRAAPTWPADASLSAGADQVLTDRPAGADALMLGGHVHLTWPAASDDVAVVRYRVYREQVGMLLPRLGRGAARLPRRPS